MESCVLNKVFGVTLPVHNIRFKQAKITTFKRAVPTARLHFLAGRSRTRKNFHQFSYGYSTHLRHFLSTRASRWWSRPALVYRASRSAPLIHLFGRAITSAETRWGDRYSNLLRNMNADIKVETSI